jgi:NAD(P)-dependent dehydrogenase (short-subunit alcohol dehydrogenase family)
MPDDTIQPETALARFQLAGRVAIVTGASSGLGARFARVLCGAGATVVGTARRAERLAVLSEGRDIIPVVGDINDEAVRAEVLRTALEISGRLDILVNNAGAAVISRAEDETLEDFQRITLLNLVTPFAMAQLAGRHMIANGGGAIINIASIYGLVASGPGEPHAGYAASKGGLVTLTRELAAQWGRHNVRVNAIAPGYFPTEMTGDAFENPKILERITRSTPLRRHGRIDELDGALLFLAGSASSYITGQVLAVDGGWTAM